MDMSWQALLQEAAATSFEKTADTLAAAENDNCACIDLHQQQIHELSKKILLLPHQGRVLLLSRYCFRLSPEETEKRCVYLCSKALSVFFVSFVSTLFLFLLNLFLVYVTCPSSMELSETMIPHTGTFSALLFQKSPLYEAVTYVILHAFALSLLTVLYLAIQMIVKAKNKYMAFILPPIIMYVLDYLTQTAAQTYSVTMALQPMVARATSFVITIEDIAIIFGALLAIDIVCLFIGNRRNRDVI